MEPSSQNEKSGQNTNKGQTNMVANTKMNLVLHLTQIKYLSVTVSNIWNWNHGSKLIWEAYFIELREEFVYSSLVPVTWKM